VRPDYSFKADRCGRVAVPSFAGRSRLTRASAFLKLVIVHVYCTSCVNEPLSWLRVRRAPSRAAHVEAEKVVQRQLDAYNAMICRRSSQRTAMTSRLQSSCNVSHHVWQAAAHRVL
jgi:hypothetical protein